MEEAGRAYEQEERARQKKEADLRAALKKDKPTAKGKSGAAAAPQESQADRDRKAAARLVAQREMDNKTEEEQLRAHWEMEWDIANKGGQDTAAIDEYWQKKQTEMQNKKFEKERALEEAEIKAAEETYLKKREQAEEFLDERLAWQDDEYKAIAEKRATLQTMKDQDHDNELGSEKEYQDAMKGLKLEQNEVDSKILAYA